MQIQVKSIVHKGESRLALYFAFDSAIIKVAKSVPGCTYSSTLKAFHYPRTKETVAALQKAFAGMAELVKAKQTDAPTSITKPNENTTPAALTQNHAKHISSTKTPAAETKTVVRIVKGDSTVEGKIQQFRYWMQSRRYSQNTVNTYADVLRTFLRFMRHKGLHEICNADVILFNNEYIQKQGLSASYQNQAVSAIKLFFVTVENRALVVEEVHRPKKPKLLPNVLSKEEVKLILNAHSNLKHRTMLGLVYSCGLRRSELLNLKPNDIDSKRNLLIVRQGKGKKDRIVPLSAKTIEMLRHYYDLYKPTTWLFEGQHAKCKYDERSLANVLKQALEKTGINKPVSLHWLRHSYATHLLEAGTNLRYIQEILGHSSSKTTEIYTHVSRTGIQNVISPFDSL